jgi:sporulation protein YlmC with PRC-barrel domain
MRHLAPEASDGSTIWGDLELFDRRIVDSEGEFAGTVDDVELETLADGRIGVAALLVGRGALTRRINRRLGRWIESIHARLHPDQPLGPVRIPFSYVSALTPAIRLSVPRRELGLTFYDDEIARHVIGHIPGADHAPE